MLITASAHAQSLSQQVISTAGSFSSSGGFSLSATTGETVTETFSGNANYLLSQGFQQSFDFVTKIEGVQHEDQLVLFPNPCDHYFFAQVPVRILSQEFDLQVFDGNGKIIINQHFQGNFSNEIFFNMSNEAPGIYFLELRCPSLKLISNCKFIKMNY